MKNICILVLLSFTTLQSCKKGNNGADKGSEGLTHEDVVSLEKNSVFSNELLVYKGTFEGKYNGSDIVLKLFNDEFKIEYKGEQYDGKLFKKDDGSLMEVQSKNKKLPFQFLKWSDNSEIMILNKNGMADENGENYLTRTSD